MTGTVLIVIGLVVCLFVFFEPIITDFVLSWNHWRGKKDP